MPRQSVSTIHFLTNRVLIHCPTSAPRVTTVISCMYPSRYFYILIRKEKYNTYVYINIYANPKYIFLYNVQNLAFYLMYLGDLPILVQKEHLHSFHNYIALLYIDWIGHNLFYQFSIVIWSLLMFCYYKQCCS